MFESDPQPARLYHEIAIEIPDRPPNTNDANRQTPQQKWRIRREWRERAAEEARLEVRAWERRHGAKWPKLPKAIVAVTFVLPDRRRRDVDNLVSSLKPLLDGIVDAGVVKDDSIETLVEWSIDSVIVKGSSSTMIVLKEPVE
jgi:Holliday junction resolvase RusA-like endonuclease